jgi:transcription elongation factor Elf1
MGMETTKFEAILKTQDSTGLKPCGDCGLLVKNRVVQFAVYDITRNPHWKKKCLECGKKSVVSHPIKNV